MDVKALARRLLDLQDEYARYGEIEVLLDEMGRVPGRAPDDIVEDYARTLREFMNSG